MCADNHKYWESKQRLLDGPNPEFSLSLILYGLMGLSTQRPLFRCLFNLNVFSKLRPTYTRPKEKEIFLAQRLYSRLPLRGLYELLIV